MQCKKEYTERLHMVYVGTSSKRFYDSQWFALQIYQNTAAYFFQAIGKLISDRIFL